MKREFVACDHCSQDLSGTHIYGHRLALQAEKIPLTTPGPPTVANYPAIEDDMHFCGLRCLYRWLSKKMES